MDAASGEPLANRKIWLNDSSGKPQALQSDAQGRIEIEKGAGTFTLSIMVQPRPGQGEGAEVHWSAEGVEPATVRLPVPD